MRQLAASAHRREGPAQQGPRGRPRFDKEPRGRARSTRSLPEVRNPGTPLEPPPISSFLLPSLFSLLSIPLSPTHILLRLTVWSPSLSLSFFYCSYFCRSGRKHPLPLYLVPTFSFSLSHTQSPLEEEKSQQTEPSFIRVRKVALVHVFRHLGLLVLAVLHRVVEMAEDGVDRGFGRGVEREEGDEVVVVDLGANTSAAVKGGERQK